MTQDKAWMSVELFTKGARLEEKIRKNLGGLGYEF